MPNNPLPSWKSVKAALFPKTGSKHTNPSTVKEVFFPKNFYHVGPTCVSTCDISPIRLGLRKTCDTVSSDVSNIVRECVAGYLKSKGYKAKYMTAYDTAMISLPSEALVELLDLLDMCFLRFNDTTSSRILRDILLMRNVGRIPGLDYQEARWSHDCEVVRYEDLLIVRFQNMYGVK